MTTFEALGDRFLALLATYANLDTRVAMVKSRKNGYIVVFKVQEEEQEFVNIKRELVSVLRSFASEEDTEYLTQYFRVGSNHYLVVQLVYAEGGAA